MIVDLLFENNLNKNIFFSKGVSPCPGSKVPEDRLQ
jgi:hypothetical protein